MERVLGGKVEDLQLALTAARVEQKNFGLWLKNWQLGQMLNALVTAQRPGGDLVLRVAGQQITARADIPVQQGTQLLLEVKQLQPQVVLKIIPQPVGSGSPPSAAGTSPAAAAGGGLLQLLSADGTGTGTRTVADIAGTLRALQAAPGPGNANPAQRLLASLPGLADLLTAPGLRRALLSSGTFLEATLAQAASPENATFRPAGGDLKALLMRVLEQVNAALQRTAGEAAAGGRSAFLVEAQRDLEVVLGSITLNQLQSQSGESNAVRGWIADVPFILGQHVGSMRLRLERDGGGAGAGEGAAEARWRVEVQLDLPELGPLLLKTQLQSEAVTVELAAREDSTRELLTSRAGELVAALNNAGLETPSLQVSAWPAHREPRMAPADARAEAPSQSWRA